MEELFKESSVKVKFVPCVKWVKRGVAKSCPEKVELTKEELKQVISQTRSKLRIANENEAGTSQTRQNEEDEFDFENYDEEDDVRLGLDEVATVPNEEDNDSDSDSEKEDDMIKPDDNLIIVANVEDNASVLEVYVHNENEGSLYVHHDFMLPSIPLCLEWLNYEPGQSDKGNLCAVGSMTPVIEVWDLDIVNCLEAAFTLGRQSSRRKGIKGIGHKDAVLDLAWNQNFHHVLGSCSVDQTIMLWDLDQGEPHTVISQFQEKVQCIEWHATEAHTLLAGSCDKTVKVFDCRDQSTFTTWEIDGEVERVLWDPETPNTFFCGSSTGTLQCFDSRGGSMWSTEAHEKEVTGVVRSDRCPGFLVTTGAEGALKVWDYKYNNIPRLVHTKDMGMGTLHCLELCPDSVFTIAAGGDNKQHHFSVLDLTVFDSVKHTFRSRNFLQTKIDESMDESD